MACCKRRSVLAVATIVAALAACAGDPPKPPGGDAAAGPPQASIGTPHGPTGPAESGRAARIDSYVRIGQTIEDAAGVQASLLLSPEPAVNAFAGYRGVERVITINMGLLDRLQPTDEEFAALVGHELAHFALNHYARNLKRQKALGVIGLIVGTASGLIGIPLGGGVAELAMQLVDSKFSRKQEQAADRLGLEFLQKAGFPGAAAVSLQRKLEAASTSKKIPFLSSHPSGEARMAYLEQLVERGPLAGAAERRDSAVAVGGPVGETEFGSVIE